MMPIPIALMLLAALPACQPRTIPEAKPNSAPVTRTGFDGQYTGFLEVIGHGGNTPSGWCETTSTFPLQITNSQFELLIPHPNVPGNSTIVFQVHITPTGHFDAQSTERGVSLKGQVSDRGLDGHITGIGCQYLFHAVAVPAPMTGLA